MIIGAIGAAASIAGLIEHRLGKEIVKLAHHFPLSTFHPPLSSPGSFARRLRPHQRRE
jgi:hypothetical protein